MRNVSHRTLAVIVLGMASLPTFSPTGWAHGKNLVKNGGFEQGKNGRPVAWSKIDDLTIFWEHHGRPGRCIHMDTDVYRSEWQKNKDHPGSVRKKTPTTGNKYNTIGGSVGAALYSAPIPVESDAWYLVEFDVKGPGGEPFLYIKGYRVCTKEDAEREGTLIFFKPFADGPSFSLISMGGVGQEKRRPHPGDYLQVYRARVITKFTPHAKGQWHHVWRVVHFKKQRHIQAVLLELYAYWPPGDYYFDNVSMRKLSEAEAKRQQAKRTKYSIPLPEK